MPELVAPDVAVQRSFLDAVEELRAEGDTEGWTGTAIFPEERWPDEVLRTRAGFTAFVSRLNQAEKEDCPGRPEAWVPATTLWWLGGGEYLGRLSIRHRLTDFLLNVGGHIGYVVRPSARCRGHATAMLAAARPVTAGLGIDPALVTCDLDNEASRKVIERNGGVLEDARDTKLRYWVPTRTD